MGFVAKCVSYALNYLEQVVRPNCWKRCVILTFVNALVMLVENIYAVIPKPDVDLAQIHGASLISLFNAGTSNYAMGSACYELR